MRSLFPVMAVMAISVVMWCGIFWGAVDATRAVAPGLLHSVHQSVIYAKTKAINRIQRL